MANSETPQRTKLRREPSRGAHDHETINAILDEAKVAHVGFAVDGQPFVIPTLHARVGDAVYIHGSSASHMLRSLASGVPACVTVTLFDGIVLARSIFDHDVNYRSVVLFGQMQLVSDPEEKLQALEAFSEQLLPGRWAEAREPTEQELKATSILRMTVEEASAKIGADGPGDADTEDGLLDIWAGTIPVKLSYGDPIPDPALRDGIATSSAALEFIREHS